MEFASHTKVEGTGSDRQFGIVFAIVFFVVGLWPLLGDGSVRLWSMGVGVGLLAVAFIAPKILAPANFLWGKLGLLLGAIVAPIVLFLLFIVAVTPTGLLLRLFGKDPLRRKRQEGAESYWITRDEETLPSSMRDQF